MQTQLVDKKLSIIFDKYRDRDFASNAQNEVEEIRRHALKVGGAATAGAFFLNEVARLSMRSRKYYIGEGINLSLCFEIMLIPFISLAVFKLKIQNVLFWLVAPTAASKYYYDAHIHERIDNMWRIHTNRVDKGK